jgi:hypothetical protein
MMQRTRWFPRAAAAFVALALPFVGIFHTKDAPASVSVAATWDGLLNRSSAAALVTAAESHSVWEDGRIFTYTRVHVDQPIAGDLGASADAWVRTMGGVVGKVGQIVEGEAAFAQGDQSLVFLRSGPAGSYVVTARGQGQYPVVRDEVSHRAHIVQSHAVGVIVQPRVQATGVTPRLAADVIHGRPVDDVVKQIASEWASAHAP